MFSSLRTFYTRKVYIPHRLPRFMSVAQGNNQKVIGTHSGTFHCDEALAVFLLRQTTTYHDAPVRRTRDPTLLSDCAVIVDVGGVYDPASHRFDHHQRGFEEVFGGSFSTKLSSAGLIYKHFGKEIISKTVNLPLDHPTVELLWLKLYKDFIEPIDGNDNGISRYPSDVQPKYSSGGTDLPARVARLNPSWNQPSDPQISDSSFERASTLTGTEFLERLNWAARSWLPARELVVAALEERFQVDPSGQILLLNQSCPWKAHLFEIESSHLKYASPQAIYVLYPDELGNSWRMQTVPVTPDSFENRKSLPEAWRGFRDDELSERCGVEGAVFVHASGFTGGNKTKEGALKMVRLALSA